MRDILVFYTADANTFDSVMKEKSKAENRIFLVSTKDRAEIANKKYRIEKSYITDMDHIDYYDYRQNLELMKFIRWNEIWLLSSGINNLYSFIDCLCIISELRFDKMYFRDSQGSIVEKTNKDYKFGLESGLKKIILFAYRLFNRINNMVLGYRW